MEKIVNLLSTKLKGETRLEEKYIAVQLQKLFSNHVNNFLFDPKQIHDEICKNNTARENFELIAENWIQMLAKQKSCCMFDGRNEYACMIGEKLNPFLARKEIPTTIQLFSEEMSREHRTLQQSFSSLVFLYIAKWHPDYAESAGLKEEKFWKCPMI